MTNRKGMRPFADFDFTTLWSSLDIENRGNVTWLAVDGSKHEPIHSKDRATKRHVRDSTAPLSPLPHNRRYFISNRRTTITSARGT